MLWYVTASLSCCGATLIAVIGLLALSSFYVYDNQKNVPSDTTDDWMTHVTALVPLTVVFALSSAYGGWVILSKQRKWFFLGLLIWNFACFAVCVYFNVAFSLQHDEPKLKSDALFAKTLADIKNQLSKDGGKAVANNDGKFIPVWLDNIQNKSKECCGIRTFRDWEEFWPGNENEVPKSCCKEPNDPEKCLTNLLSIPFPGVPSMFIKTDTGCMDEINAHLRKNIHDCFIFLIIICVLFGLSQIVYVLQYCLDYGSKSGSSSSSPDSGAGDDIMAPPPQKIGSRLFGFFRKKRTPKADVEGAISGISGGDAYDLSGVQSGSLTNASAYTASQGTLPDSLSQDPYFNKGALYSGNQPQAMTPQPLVDLAASPASSGSDIDIGSDTGVMGEPKKKKKRKHKKKSQQDDMVGSDGADGKLNRQEVFLVPDMPTGSRNDYRNDFQAANQSADLLAQNGYDPAATSTTSPNQASSPTAASPTGSQDDVGDKLAPGLRPTPTKKDKLMGFLGGSNGGGQKKKK